MPGHWEGELLFGSRNTQIATLVERQTRYVMLVKVDSKDTETVINALIKHARTEMKKLNLLVLAVVVAAHALVIHLAVRESVKGREHFTEVALMPKLSQAPVMYAKASAPQ